MLRGVLCRCILRENRTNRGPDESIRLPSSSLRRTRQGLAVAGLARAPDLGNDEAFSGNL